MSHEEHGQQSDLARGSEQPLHCQGAVEAEADKWAKEWMVDCPEPIPIWPAAIGEPLPVLSVDVALHACVDFPMGTGLGWDQLHPRALQRISRNAFGALMRLFMLAELLGRWPTNIGVVIVALIPKSDGGRRPIGLCPTLIRLWMRIRLPVAQAWQSAHDRQLFFAGEDKGADIAAFKQTARAEVSAMEGGEYAVALLDLVKPFDGMHWDWLVLQASVHSYTT